MDRIRSYGFLSSFTYTDEDFRLGLKSAIRGLEPSAESRNRRKATVIIREKFATSDSIHDSKCLLTKALERVKIDFILFKEYRSFDS